MKRFKFVVDNYYHIYNRGVEKRNIFLDGADYFRFLLGMKEFNNVNPVFHLHRRTAKAGNLSEVGLRTNRANEEPLVEFVCYSLMPNHYHVVVKQLTESGVSKFMQKLGTGYVKYFNKRYERKGVLFEGAFKCKVVSTDEYIVYLSKYIHLNSLSLFQSDWKENGIKDKNKAFIFLTEYKWHNLPFWLSDKPCLVKLNPDIVLKQFPSRKDYKKFLMNWTESDLERIEKGVFG